MISRQGLKEKPLQIGDDWPKKLLGELIHIKHGYAFKGEYFSDSGPFVVLTPGNFHDEGGFKDKGDKEKHYVGKVPKDFILKKGDLLVAMTEQSEGLLGSPATVPLSDYYLHNQRLGLVTEVDKTLIDRTFLYYLFNTRQVRQQIRASASGTKVRHTSPSRIYEVAVPVPSLAVQRKVAEILSAYDALIENNTRRVKTLEKVSQSLYREWFVRFRFPGHARIRLIDSPLGVVPQGWEVRRVKDILKRLPAGQVYTEKTVSTSGEVPVVDQSRDDVLGYHNNEPDHAATPDSPVIAFGDHTCKMQLMVEPFSVGPNVVPFVSQNLIPVFYLYFIVSNLVKTHEYKRHWTELTAKQVVLAPDVWADRFAKVATPMFEQMNALVRKNLNLRRTRDLLLPGLISGEIAV